MKSIITHILLFTLFLSCSTRDYETVTIKGSDSEVNMALNLAETFMMQDSAISIAVTGGGSGAGIASLINNKCDIANSSRPFKLAEVELARERGITVTPVVFAIDALAIVTHPSVGIDSLTIEQVAQIFKGTINNWKALGSRDAGISLYGRQSNSGTFVYVQQNILKGEYSNAMKQMNGTAQILEAIKTDPNSIGYVGIGYIINKEAKAMDGVKVLSIKPSATSPAVNPTNRQAIINGDYIITRPLYQYTNGNPTGKTKAFIQFELSQAGQAIVERNGYFPITKQYKQQNSQYGL